MKSIGPFQVTVNERGVGSVVFDRPPVNALSIDVYEALLQLVEAVSQSTEIRVLVVSAPSDARAWCGGADLKDFAGITVEDRKRRYAVINRALPALYHLDRPVIAAINGHAIGVGVILAAVCDLRVAADSAAFACPEIDYGLVAGGGGLFSWLKMPEARVREMLYTGRRFSAEELRDTGFFNYIVPRDEVVVRAGELAELIARKSLPAVQARKRVSTASEGLVWTDAYLLAQDATAALTSGRDGDEGVHAFLEHRSADYRDR
jgi:enoyl-CoA hydratase/carnithine racemase